MDDISFTPFELEPSWHKVLETELNSPYMTQLAAFVERERQTGPLPVYPPKELVFNAFRKTPYEQVKVVIVGQDPYHGPNQAHGLSFSVAKDVPIPPSLRNIYKELQDDLGIKPPAHGCLTTWAEQGVLMLNTLLTVRKGEPMSHKGRGWERFTDQVVAKIAESPTPVIFVLWGRPAQEKCRHVKQLDMASHHIFLTCPHPSPLSAHQGFFGCRHFSKINALLVDQGVSPIDWQILPSEA